MEGVDSAKPLSEGADRGVIIRSCLFSRGESKDERSYTPEEQKEIEKFMKERDEPPFAACKFNVRPVARIIALKRENAAINKKNAAIKKKKAALLRKNKSALKVNKREEHPWAKLYKLFDASNFDECCISIGLLTPVAQLPSTSKEVHDMLQFRRDQHAKFALKYYNDKTVGTKFELVKGLKVFDFFGPRIELIKYPILGFCGPGTGWCHINFMAKPINADSANPSEAKLFFAEMHGIYRKDSEFISGVTLCSIVEPNNSDEAACAYCKGILHPAGVDFIASPLVEGFPPGEKSLR